MSDKPTYKELESRIKALEKNAAERKLVEKALRASEATLKSIFRAAPTGIGMVADRVIRQANERLCEMTGYAREELLGQSARTLYPDDTDYEFVGKEKYKQIEKYGTGTVETRWRHKDGKIIDVLLSSTPIDPDDLSKGVTFTALDITSRKQAEKSLRESETLLNKSQEIAHIGSWRLDLTKNDLYWSDEVYRIFGLAPQDFGATYEAFLQAVHPDDREAVDLAYKRALQNQQPYEITHRVLRPDGSTRIVREKSENILDASGKPVVSFGMVHDITEQVHAEAARRESDRMLNDVFNSIQDGISVLNTDLTIRKVNGVMKKWYDKNAPLEGKKCYLCYHDRDRPCDPCPTIRCISSGQTEREIVPGLPGSPVKWVELFSFPIKDQSSGKVTGVVEFVRDITQRVRKDEALREAEEKFRVFFNSLNDSVFVHPLNDETFANFIEVNDAACRRYEYSREEFLRMTPLDMVKKEDLYQQSLQVSRKKLMEKGSLVFETLQISRSGREIPVEISSNIIELNDQKVILSVARDITERKKIETALVDSERRHRFIAENVMDVIWTRGMDLRLTYVSPSVEDLTGHTVEEAMQRELEESWTPESFELIKAALAEELEMERSEEKDPARSRTIEVEVRHKEGTPIWTEAKMSFLRDQTGEAVGIIGVTRDISERKIAELALKDSEEKYRTVLEANPDPVVVYDIEGKVVYFNPAFTSVFGWSLEERLGKKMDLFVPEENWPETQVMISKVVAGKSFSGIESRRYTKAGKIISVSLSGSIYRDREAKPIGSIITLRDISSQKLLEEQLFQSQKMEAIGTLAGGIAHDFNNLLMGIQGRTSLMMSEMEASHPQFEHLEGIEEYVKSAADLTKQLLAFARGGKYEIKPTDLNELIRKNSEMFGRTKKEIAIHRKFEEDVWTVEVDRSQIDQVMLNLYVNAWQSMPAGGDLYLETRNVVFDENYEAPYTVEPGQYVKVSITDNGVGMDKATQEKIFDPFFTTKEMGRGTGLGLASAYGIIKSHGGFIDVFSKKGEGTTFNFYLPASDKAVRKEEGAVGEVLSGSGTVLLVDDEEMIIEVGRPMLEKMGYSVLTARDGTEAIEIYRKNPQEITLVILDMIMPHMGGGETYDKLKEINDEVKVLLSSGYSINGLAMEILYRGCNGFIQKPFTIKDLSQKIKAVLGKN